MSDEQAQQSTSPLPMRVRRQGQRMTAEERTHLQDAFLEVFKIEANLSLACDAVGIDLSTPYDWKQRYKDFAKRFEEAEQRSNDRIDHEIYRRAVVGWEEPAISAGRVVYDEELVLDEDTGEPKLDRNGRVIMRRGKMVTLPRHSDAMMTLLAKARMAKYRDKQQVEHSGAIDLAGARDSLMSKLSTLPQQESDAETEDQRP